MNNLKDDINIEDLYNSTSNDLKSYLFSKEKDPALIDDIVQDTFLKLYSYQSQGKKINNPKSWLFKVASNLLIDHFRRKRSLINSVDALGDINSQNSDSPHEPGDCLLGIIASLPYKYKKAVYLTDVKGIRQTVAAKELSLSLPTFKSHVQRGRNLVAQGYVDCCDYKINEKGHLKGESKDWKECKVCSQSV